MAQYAIILFPFEMQIMYFAVFKINCILKYEKNSVFKFKYLSVFIL